MDKVAGVLVLAALAEGFVEYFIVPLLQKANAADYAKYVALVAGVALCVAYQVDILLSLVGLVPINPYVGFVLSGIIVGRGSNYVNDFIDVLRGLATVRVAR